MMLLVLSKEAIKYTHIHINRYVHTRTQKYVHVHRCTQNNLIVYEMIQKQKQTHTQYFITEQNGFYSL